ncbi:hypothetical protein B9Z55_027703 [Caenorhabditis nigoni]|uniref:Uncharacterized protein n=1 Tax=Caenorhabditis nigoni TaxID=1611254 RepID=A0A2G5SEX6_9PELO|nr:hypothetical protein B9Z55_027703 [Caenorhabditis nigoni]
MQLLAKIYLKFIQDHRLQDLKIDWDNQDYELLSRYQLVKPSVQQTTEQPAPIHPSNSPIGVNSKMLAPKDNFFCGIGGESERYALVVRPSQDSSPEACVPSAPELSALAPILLQSILLCQNSMMKRSRSTTKRFIVFLLEWSFC